jgi:TonB family protein
MKAMWIAAAGVSIAAHAALAAWVDTREPAPKPKHPPIEMRLAAAPKPKRIEPRPPPPVPAPPRLVKKLALRPRPQPSAPAAPPPPSPKIGVDESATAERGDIAVATGGSLDGEVGTGTETKEPAPLAPPAPPTATKSHFVPIYQVTRLPRATRAIAPEIPAAFRDANREAVVVVEVELDAAGHVTNAKVVRHAEFGLDDAALAAARATEFEPALVGTQPVPVRYQIPYRFRVR